MSDTENTQASCSAQGVWAVIVACNRPVELERLLRAIAAQSVVPARILVVDNGTDAAVPRIVGAYGGVYQHSQRNIGGAGGFALGMLLALAAGAESLWLWDDDGWPESDTCLATLLAAAAGGKAAIAAPLVISATDPTRSAFGFRLLGGSTFDRAAIARRPTVEGAAHLFNGALVPAATIDRFGLPDTRLFIRGDEVDFMLRVLAGHGRVVTVTTAIARHPSGEAEVHSILGGRLHAVYPTDRTRRELLFRNRGYLMRRHRRWGFLVLDALRYGAFFLLRRRPDVRGYREWMAATRRGAAEQLGPPPAANERS